MAILLYCYYYCYRTIATLTTVVIVVDVTVATVVTHATPVAVAVFRNYFGNFKTRCVASEFK